MIQIPANLIRQYTTFIEQRGVEEMPHRYYVKWLRYYFDFWHKYNLIQTGEESLSAFTEKLKEKKQAENFRKQAHHAISLFYEPEHCSGRKNPEQHIPWQCHCIGTRSIRDLPALYSTRG